MNLPSLPYRPRREPIYATVRGHTFIAKPIHSDSVVLDFGANRGEFSKIMKARYGCTPKMVEANPDLFADLKSSGEPVLHCAVAQCEGTLSFNISNNDEASSMLNLPASSELGATHDRSVTVDALSVSAIIARLGLSHVDLLKMDIEGAEVAVLETCPADVLKKIDQITIEFHCDPVFGFGQRDRVEAIMRRLQALGFSKYTFLENYTDVLFVSHARLGTGLLERAILSIRWPRRPLLIRGIWQLVPETLRHGIKQSFRPTGE
jgi:FkbM family methyltransferase